MFVIAHLHEGFVFVEVFALNNAFCLGVIWRTLDMMYAVFLRQVSNCCYKCGAIVSNNFSHSTPLAQDILKYKVSESLLVFLLKRVPLRPRGQGTMGLDEIVKLFDSEHGIDVNLVEKCRNVSNIWGKVKMMHLLSLAGMAC